MIVSKWGNSLGVRIPAATVKAMGLMEGDEVEITIQRKPDVELRLAQLQKFRGRMPADFLFDREEIHERSRDK
jgi:antitoxin MazE